MLLGAGRPQGAIEDFDKVLEQQPLLVAALVNRGRAHASAGSGWKARSDFERALAVTADEGLRARINTLMERLT